MRIASLDENERRFTKLDLPAIDYRFAGTTDDVKPLVGRAVAIFGTAFVFSRRQGHGSGLRTPVAQHDMETLCETEMPVMHTAPFWKVVGNEMPAQFGVVLCRKLQFERRI